ncbi:hypothetical protein XENTR_v10023992 [Xenopus tropicalis]|nr:hypothetical protein XENTR_v10023992 [Xenopus tropicalis]
MISNHLKLWIFLGLCIICLLRTPVTAQDYDYVEYKEPEIGKLIEPAKNNETTIATEQVTKVHHGLHKSTTTSSISKEDIYIITIALLLALIVALGTGWYLHCRFMLLKENFKIAKPLDIDIEKGPNPEPITPQVPPAEKSQKQAKKTKKGKQPKVMAQSESQKKKKKKKTQENTNAPANATEQK